MLNRIPLPKPGNAEQSGKPKLPEIQNKKVQQEKVQQRKTKQNNNEEELSPEIVELRKTDRWKSMYMRNLQSKDAIKGGEKYKEKVYCELIDRLASPPVDQNNILASFLGFANDNFKYTND